MGKAFIYTILILCYSCGQADCSLHEYEKSFWWHKRFNQFTWRKGDIDLNNRYFLNADSTYLYYQVLSNREKMLCDLVQNHLKPSQNIVEIIAILGPGEKYTSLIRGKILLEKENPERNLTDEIFETKLLYEVGYNASGTCYLVLVFDKNQYIGCYLAVHNGSQNQYFPFATDDIQRIADREHLLYTIQTFRFALS